MTERADQPLLCPRCGVRNPGSAFNCSRCGARIRQRPEVQTWLPHALLALVLFPPTGLVCLAWSVAVMRRLRTDRFSAAMAASRQARLWYNLSWVVPLVALGVVLLDVVLRAGGR